jgi:hypothetical protein
VPGDRRVDPQLSTRVVFMIIGIQNDIFFHIKELIFEMLFVAISIKNIPDKSPSYLYFFVSFL